MRHLDSFKELKVLYEAPLTQLLDIFPHWTEEDLVAALSDLKGDLEMPWAKSGKKPVKRDVSTEPFIRRNYRKNPPVERQVLNKEPIRPERPHDKQQASANTVEIVTRPSEANAAPEPATSNNVLENSKTTEAKCAANVKRYTSINSENAKTKAIDPKGVRHMQTKKDSVELCEGSLVHEEKLAHFVSSIVEEEAVHAAPIVQMPKTLSSRISSSIAVQQPVVVLPLKATVRPGLSVNFGAANQSSLGGQTQIVRTLDNSLNAMNHIASPETATPRYTSTSVEATLLSSPRNESSDVTGARRSQPIQRPVQSANRDNYMTPPPGLASEISPLETHFVSHGSSYTNAKAASPVNRYSQYPSGGSHYSHDDIADASYYSQGSRPHYQQSLTQSVPPATNFSRSMDFNKPSVENGRPAQPFGAPWNTYANPQGQHGNYYPNTHYSQHVYPEASAYHQQPHYSVPPANRYSNQPPNTLYNSTNPYGAGGFYGGVNDQNFGNQQAPRSGTQPASRQVFSGTFPQTKNL
ncbi:hypothetical protein PSACC_03085 [Paramicrosporidium saccamoebae]|uniref:CUE domain-containing protein n=1 Tax=Paramicrosporidium saccamoebae TaxID=1246581 RepID=A0A2H9TH37_9FUNG|nr:hypothetical protein PSACC_03085 [Paramicrosporidium saccamoebae]